MKVFKFGGASLKNASGVQNVASIIAAQAQDNLLVVVSAMGKTTDMLERVLALASSKKDHSAALDELKKYHYEIIDGLFQSTETVLGEVNVHFNDLEKELQSKATFDQVYDQVVSKGELISSVIVHHYLLSRNIASYWHDSRTSVRTDNNFREGRVDWTRTSKSIELLRSVLKKKYYRHTRFYWKDG